VTPPFASLRFRASLAGTALLALSAALAGVAARVLPRQSAVLEWWLAARGTLTTTFVVVVLAPVIGLALAFASTLGPRVVDSALSRATEIASALPSVVVVLVVAQVGPFPGFFAVAVALSTLRGLETAKIARAAIRSLSVTEHVLAARAVGAGETRLFRVHLLPHVLRAALSTVTLTAAAAMGLEAALAVLGVGAFGPSFGAELATALRTGSVARAITAILCVVGTTYVLQGIALGVDARLGVGRRFS
jgi:ABC-type dipeptide/oligopeptide/nickel transport system permease subunit